MATAAATLEAPCPALSAGSAGTARFALLAGSILAGAWLLSTCCPLGFSIAIVFLFAGPHNWCEARYFLTKMPARWGKLRPYFLTGILGAPALAGASALVHYQAGSWGWDHEAWMWWLATWNTLFVFWLLALVTMRSRQNPRRDWLWVWPAGLALVALNWQWPLAWSLALVYLHPLVALWFLDRELGRQRPEWRRVYRGMLCSLPVLCVAQICLLSGQADLPGYDMLSQQITHHAGAGILPSVSSHLLVSLHTFLEMLHYAVWVIAMPMVGLAGAPWQLSDAPLAKRSPVWRLAVYGVLLVGATVVLAFWAAFAADYPATRDVYFTVALVHVLAEAPFLLRLL
jgi:hypothetical protein